MKPAPTSLEGGIFRKAVVGGCWPTDDQRLILHPALARGPAAIEALGEWERLGGFDTTDESSFRLLPLVYRNLRDQGLEHPRMRLLRGIHRQAWYRNQLLLHEVCPLLRSMHEAGFRTLLVKGLPWRNSTTATWEHGRCGIWMSSFLPRRGRGPQFSGVSRLEGENMVPHKPAPYYFRFRHSVSFIRDTERELDLHWHVLFDCRCREADAEFWSAAVPLGLDGIETRTLCPTDHLIHVCAHGLAWNELPPIRWIADSMELLRRPETIRWDRLLEHARRFRLSLGLRSAFRLLVDEYDAPIPVAVLESLERLPFTYGERCNYQAVTNPLVLQPIVARLAGLYDCWSRGFSSGGLLTRLLSFPRFLQCHWQLDHASFLPAHLAKWGKRRAAVRWRSRDSAARH